MSKGDSPSLWPTSKKNAKGSKMSSSTTPVSSCTLPSTTTKCWSCSSIRSSSRRISSRWQAVRMLLFRWRWGKGPSRCQEADAHEDERNQDRCQQLEESQEEVARSQLHTLQFWRQEVHKRSQSCRGAAQGKGQEGLKERHQGQGRVSTLQSRRKQVHRDLQDLAPEGSLHQPRAHHRAFQQLVPVLPDDHKQGGRGRSEGQWLLQAEVGGHRETPLHFVIFILMAGWCVMRQVINIKSNQFKSNWIYGADLSRQGQVLAL